MDAEVRIPMVLRIFSFKNLNKQSILCVQAVCMVLQDGMPGNFLKDI